MAFLGVVGSQKDDYSSRGQSGCLSPIANLVWYTVIIMAGSDLGKCANITRGLLLIINIVFTVSL